MTLYFPSSADSSALPPFSSIARAAAGQLFPIALQIEMHYQCRYAQYTFVDHICIVALPSRSRRCTSRTALLPPKLIKQWELPLFGFFSVDVSVSNPSCHFSDGSPCDSATADSAANPCIMVGGDSSSCNSSNVLNQEVTGSNNKLRRSKLHLLALRQSSPASESSLARACNLFQRLQSLDAAASGAGIPMLPDFKLPLLSSDCISKLCDASHSDVGASLDEPVDECTLKPMLSSNYVPVNKPTVPSFQSYESKFRFLDLQVPPVLRPVVACVFAAAVSAANDSSSGLQASGSASHLASSSAAVHPLSLSPARHTQTEMSDKRTVSASARSSKQPVKRTKSSDASFAVPSSRISVSASTNSKASSNVITGEVSTFASVTDAPRTLVADTVVVPKKSAAIASSSQNLKIDKQSPGYEQLKSKLWSKLHTKFRRETQPAIDIDLLRTVYNRCVLYIMNPKQMILMTTALQHAAGLGAYSRKNGR